MSYWWLWWLSSSLSLPRDDYQRICISTCALCRLFGKEISSKVIDHVFAFVVSLINSAGTNTERAAASSLVWLDPIVLKLFSYHVLSLSKHHATTFVYYAKPPISCHPRQHDGWIEKSMAYLLLFWFDLYYSKYRKCQILEEILLNFKKYSNIYTVISAS